MEYRVRPMRREDLTQAAAIEKRCFSSEAWSEKVYREEFARAGSYLWLWCAVREKGSADSIAALPGREDGTGPIPVSQTHSDGTSGSMESGNAVLLGTISLTRTGEDGEIGNVAVLPEYRGQGIAGALLKTALEYGECGQGITSYTLEVRASNAAAIHLYEAHGFRTQGVRPRFYTEPCEDALIMWKKDN